MVCGSANLEMTVQVEAFPIQYNAMNFPFYGIGSGLGGVGFNIAKALTSLGSSINFLSIIGQDLAAKLILDTIKAAGIETSFVLGTVEQSAHSVVLYDKEGRRQVYSDLKNILDQSYPLDRFEVALSECDFAILTNIAYSRAFLRPTLEAGKLIGLDLQNISSLDDEYNRDFFEAAHILFMSHERLPVPPEDWAKAVINRFGTEIVVVGMGGEGALLALKENRVFQRVPAVAVRPVVNTVGAGDALFASFIHFYHKYKTPYEALKKAVWFAGYKIGESGSSKGFVSESQLEILMQPIENIPNEQG